MVATADETVRRARFVFNAAKVVDLTYTLDSTTVYWPTDQPFQHRFVHYGKSPEGYFYSSAEFAASEHCGTHMDAPIHFSQEGETVDTMPISSMIGSAIVVDFSERAANDPDVMLNLADLNRWESEHCRVPAGSIVVARSGWGRFWPDRGRYLGTSRLDETARLSFPGFSAEAARFLLNCNVAAIAIDTASVDAGNSTDFPVHRLWLGSGKPAFENLANAEKLPESGATIFCIPMKIGRGTGAPSRIFAIIP
jgi:kynurenine formamidase